MVVTSDRNFILLDNKDFYHLLDKTQTAIGKNIGTNAEPIRILSFSFVLPPIDPLQALHTLETHPLAEATPSPHFYWEWNGERDRPDRSPIALLAVGHAAQVEFQGTERFEQSRAFAEQCFSQTVQVEMDLGGDRATDRVTDRVTDRASTFSGDRDRGSPVGTRSARESVATSTATASTATAAAATVSEPAPVTAPRFHSGASDPPAFSGPHLFCSFTFFDQPPTRAPFAPATLFLPRWHLARHGSRSVLVVNCPWALGQDPDRSLDPALDPTLEALCRSVWQAVAPLQDSGADLTTLLHLLGPTLSALSWGSPPRSTVAVGQSGGLGAASAPATQAVSGAGAGVSGSAIPMPEAAMPAMAARNPSSSDLYASAIPEPATVPSVTAESVTTESVTTESVTAESVTTESVTAESVTAAPAADRPLSTALPHQFKDAVQESLAAIEAGTLGKIVLAHTLEVTSPQPFQISASLRNLRQLHPDCYRFSVANGQGQTFLGASPERLLCIANGDLQTEALAGSAPRGRTSGEDAELARSLLQNPKERHEHQLVAEFIMEQLQTLGLDPQAIAAPQLRQLANIQHLLTPIQATVPPQVHPLDLVAQLHPTPAVAGVPRQVACDQIRRWEPFDRSLYAAPLGWLDHRGNCEFIVGIRSALLDGDRARLFAGAGVVSGSDPDRELTEVELKFQTLLSALV